jgi:proteasome assembly chaperone 2
MGSTFYSPIQPNFSLNSKRLVAPVVSTANLGQLAADLLICTLNLERIGFLDDAYLVPAVGALDRSQDAKRELEGGISTSLECKHLSGCSSVLIVNFRFSVWPTRS